MNRLDFWLLAMCKQRWCFSLSLLPLLFLLDCRNSEDKPEFLAVSKGAEKNVYKMFQRRTQYFRNASQNGERLHAQIVCISKRSVCLRK